MLPVTWMVASRSPDCPFWSCVGQVLEGSVMYFKKICVSPGAPLLAQNLSTFRALLGTPCTVDKKLPATSKGCLLVGRKCT